MTEAETPKSIVGTYADLAVSTALAIIKSGGGPRFPIETAPQDREIVAWNGNYYEIAVWIDPAYEGGGGEWTDQSCRRIWPSPTHWSPCLPKPPAAAGGEA